MEKKFANNFKIYRAKPDGNGVATQFCFAKEKESIFIEMAKQLSGKDDNENAIFDWKNKIIFKLGMTDIGEILSVLQNIKLGVGPKDKDSENYKGLFHSNDKGNSILKFEKNKYGGFYIGLSVKKEGLDPVNLKHTISSGEATILNILLDRAVGLIYDWN
jgi:hypothetical protein